MVVPLLERLRAATGLRRFLAFFLAGAALSLVQAPANLFFIPFLIVPFAVWLALSEPADSPRSAMLGGWALGLGYFGLGLIWLVEPFLVDAAATGWMAPFALVLMAGGLALFWAAAFWAAQRYGGLFRGRVVSLVLFWTLAEFARAHLFTGFPWNLLTYGWIETPVAQLLALAGPHGLGLLTLLVAVLPLLVRRRLTWAAAPILVAIAWVWGAAQMPPEDRIAFTDTTVRIIQPNAVQELKWREDMIPVFFDRQLELTRRPRPNPVDVVIWPEAGLQFFLGEDSDSMAEVIEATGPGTQLIAGVRRYDRGQYYNSMVHLGADGTQLNVYDKHHLVPFGEYMPMTALADRVGLTALAAQYGGFSGGGGPRVLSGSGLPDFLPMICYEAIFPGDVQAGNDRPGWLVHLTNDAWFGKFSGPYQHLAQVRARAIEQGLPVARSANTGVSAVIGPHGRVLWSLPLGQLGHLDARLPAALPPTPYSRFGEWPWLAVVLLLGCLTVLQRRRKDRDVGGNTH